MIRQIIPISGIQTILLTGSSIAQCTFIILHGKGERGSDITLLDRYGFMKWLATQDLPFNFVLPQLPLSSGGFYPNFLDPVFDYCEKTLQVPIRFTGLSLGAMGVMANLARYGNRIASFMTCSGLVDTSSPDYTSIWVVGKTKPSKSYYDPNDGTIPYGYASMKQFYTGITIGSLVTLPGVGHNSWDFGYPDYIKSISLTPVPVHIPHLFLDDVDTGLEVPSGKVSKIEVK